LIFFKTSSKFRFHRKARFLNRLFNFLIFFLQRGGSIAPPSLNCRMYINILRSRFDRQGSRKTYCGKKDLQQLLVFFACARHPKILQSFRIN